MKLIVGLGNPEEKYKYTRHNVGYLVVDKLLQQKLPQGMIIKKSDVFMNDSGLAVKNSVNRYGLDTTDLWIIHDDLDIKLGSYKIQKGKGPKVHNGVNSVEHELGTEDFWRVRVGVDNRNPGSRTPGEAYVLQNFNENELPILDKSIDNLTEELKKLVSGGGR